MKIRCLFLSLSVVFSTVIGPMNSSAKIAVSEIPSKILSIFKNAPMKIWTCQAMLALHPDDQTKRVNPMISLRELINYLARYSQINPQEIQPSYEKIAMRKESMGDMSRTKKNVLKSIGNKLSRKKSKFQKVLNRLSQVNADTSDVYFKGVFVANEVRGWASIEALINEIDGSVEAIEHALKPSIKKRLPLLRLKTIVDLIFIIPYSILLFPQLYIDDFIYTNDLKTIVGSAFVALESSIYFAFNAFFLGAKKDYSFFKHIDSIKKALIDREKTSILSIYGNSFKVSTSFAAEMFKNSGDSKIFDFETVASESIKNSLTVFDYPADTINTIMEYGSTRNFKDHQAQLYPEGAIRHLYVDQIFYIDPETNEPVWLFYYRAFKDKPISPKKPKDKENSVSDRQNGSDPDQILQPIPIDSDRN